MVRGELYCAATRPPSVYRGNPFQIEVGLAYGGASTAQKVTLEQLTEFLSETDARTLRQFLMNTFDGPEDRGQDHDGSGHEHAEQPFQMDAKEIATLHAAMRNVNLSDGQTRCRCCGWRIVVLRYSSGNLQWPGDLRRDWK
ncbi:MAG: hypothetical protein U0894_13160 [Pirellulales bacterium]